MNWPIIEFAVSVILICATIAYVGWRLYRRLGREQVMVVKVKPHAPDIKRARVRLENGKELVGTIRSRPHWPPKLVYYDDGTQVKDEDGVPLGHPRLADIVVQVAYGAEKGAIVYLPPDKVAAVEVLIEQRTADMRPRDVWGNVAGEVRLCSRGECWWVRQPS